VDSIVALLAGLVFRLAAEHALEALTAATTYCNSHDKDNGAKISAAG
jgi:hypothetical protein